MTFRLAKVSRYKGKVYDADRCIELVSDGGSSDGTRHYRIVSQSDEANIDGKVTSGVTPSAHQTAGGIQENLNWEIEAKDRPFKFGPKDSDTASLHVIVTEALKVYGFAADNDGSLAVNVTFR